MHTLLKHAPKIVLVGLPPVEQGRLKSLFDSDKATQINTIIAELAREQDAAFADVRATIASPGATVDGVHLQGESYKPWLETVTSAITRSLPRSEKPAAAGLAHTAS